MAIDECLHLLEATHKPAMRANFVHSSGEMALLAGDFDRAEQDLTQAAREGRSSGNSYVVAIATMDLGTVAVMRGDLVAAAVAYAEAAPLITATENAPTLLQLVCDLARLAWRAGDPPTAARLAGSAQVAGRQVPRHLRAGVEALLAEAVGADPAAAAAGAKLTLEQAKNEGVAFCERLANAAVGSVDESGPRTAALEP